MLGRLMTFPWPPAHPFAYMCRRSSLILSSRGKTESSNVGIRLHRARKTPYANKQGMSRRVNEDSAMLGGIFGLAHRLSQLRRCDIRFCAVR